MGGFKNVMQVFTLLDKSNCRKCGEKTCLAFAAAVFKGEKDISACPLLSEEIVAHGPGAKMRRLNSMSCLTRLRELTSARQPFEQVGHFMMVD